METHIIFIRHGETQWNAERRFQGRKDIPLNQNGKEQAVIAGKRISEYLSKNAGTLISQIYSSPAIRAKETAELVAQQLGMNKDAIITDDRLLELDGGDCEGEFLDVVQSKYSDFWNSWRRNGADPNMSLPNGEPLIDKYNRVENIIREIVSKYQGQTILLASHFGVLQDVYRIAKGISPHQSVGVPKDNAGIHSLFMSVDQKKPSCVQFWKLYPDQPIETQL